MDIHPAGSPVILSPAESLPRDQGTDSRFPYATAYLGFQIVIFGLLILPTLALSAIHDAWARRIIQFVLYIPVLFFVFRWAINKHVLPYVTLATNDLTDYRSRFSFKNPFLTGIIAYLAMTWLTSAVVAPITEPLKLDLTPVGSALSFLIDVVVGYLPFTIAVKRVVLQPYQAKRLVPLLGLIMVLAFSVSFAISLAKVRQEWAFLNHVYCEVLQPGMTQTEVTAALSEYGARGQFPLEHGFDGPGTEKAVSFTEPYFHDAEIEYRLNLVLGFDSNNALVAVGREHINLTNYAFTVSAIECPLPIR